MTEPATSAVAGVAAWKMGLLSKLGVLVGGGALGALLIAAVDPAEAEPDPRKRRRLIFTQVLVAGAMSMTFTPATVRWLASWNDWIQLGSGNFEAWAEVTLPVALTIGALGWGMLGAAVKLRQMVRDRGADAIAEKAGLK